MTTRPILDVDAAPATRSLQALQASALTSRTALLGVGAAAAAAGAAISAAAISSGDELAKLSDRIGISARDLSGWRDVLERGDLTLQQFGTGVRTLQRNLVDASRGVGEAVETFRQLELNPSQLLGLDESQQLFAVFRALEQLETVTERNAAAQRLLGESGTQLGTVFSTTQADIDAAADATNEMAERAAAAADAVTDLRDEVVSLRDQAVLGTPIVNIIAEIARGGTYTIRVVTTGGEIPVGEGQGPSRAEQLLSGAVGAAPAAALAALGFVPGVGTALGLGGASIAALEGLGVTGPATQFLFSRPSVPPDDLEGLIPASTYAGAGRRTAGTLTGNANVQLRRFLLAQLGNDPNLEGLSTDQLIGVLYGGTGGGGGGGGGTTPSPASTSDPFAAGIAAAQRTAFGLGIDRLPRAQRALAQGERQRDVLADAGNAEAARIYDEEILPALRARAVAEQAAADSAARAAEGQHIQDLRQARLRFEESERDRRNREGLEESERLRSIAEQEEEQRLQSIRNIDALNDQYLALAVASGRMSSEQAAVAEAAHDLEAALRAGTAAEQRDAANTLELAEARAARARAIQRDSAAFARIDIFEGRSDAVRSQNAQYRERLRRLRLEQQFEDDPVGGQIAQLEFERTQLLSAPELRLDGRTYIGPDTSPALRALNEMIDILSGIREEGKDTNNLLRSRELRLYLNIPGEVSVDDVIDALAAARRRGVATLGVTGNPS